MNAGPNAPDSPFMIWGESILRMPAIRLPKLPIKDPPFFLRPPLLRLRYAALAARAFLDCFSLRGMFTIVKFLSAFQEMCHDAAEHTGFVERERLGPVDPGDAWEEASPSAGFRFAWHLYCANYIPIIFARGTQLDLSFYISGRG